MIMITMIWFFGLFERETVLNQQGINIEVIQSHDEGKSPCNIVQ